MKRIIFFDGVCPLCNGFVDFVLKKDTRHLFRFASLQSTFAKNSLPASYQSLDTVVLLEGEAVYTKSTAVLRVLFQLGPAWNFFAMIASIAPTFFRDAVYKLVAKNRYKIWGVFETCRIPTPEERPFFLED